LSKICIIASKNSSLINFRGDLIKEWLRLGCDVVAVAPGEEAKEEVKALGAEYVTIPLSRTGFNPLKDIKTWNAIRKILIKEKPDFLFLYTIKPVIYGSLAAYFYKKCKVYSLITGLGYVFTGDSFQHKLVKALAVLLYKMALARNEKVFFQNPDDQKSFINMNLVNHGKDVLINGSGVNIQRFSPKPLPEKTVTFLLIARLIWDKGIKEYVNAAQVIKENYPQARFLLAGPYDENPASVSEKYIEEKVNEKIIKYLGHLDDVRPVIEESSVYVLPSFYREGTPRTVLESMAMGRPIITTDAPGCRETVKNGVNGFLVPVKDSMALKEVMEKFINEPELIQEMGAKSREIAENKYDVRKVNKMINETMGLISGE